MKIYKSPIDMFVLNGVGFDELARKAAEAFDNEVITSVRKVGINVDKGELLKALEYDRGQYEKGYADAKAQYERKRGEWIYGEHDVAMCDGYRCDKCGFFVPWDYEHKFIDFINDYHFCPNCGADMRKESE